MKTIIVISVSAIILISGIGYVTFNYMQKAEEQQTQEIKKVQETVGEENADVGEGVREIHSFYNETTGYGGMNDLDMDGQVEQAEANISFVAEVEATDDDLAEDLNEINKLSHDVINTKEPEAVRSLHRYFHDLDIALNHYDGNTVVWGVTETLS